MRFAAPVALLAMLLPVAFAADPPLQPIDVFDLEVALDPQIAPDGKRVVYVRKSFDVMKDRARTRLWTVNAGGGEHRPLTDGKENESSPVWSPDGKRLAYLSGGQLHVRWMDTGATAKLTNAPQTPAAPSWSPDGKQIAFVSHVPENVKPFFDMPAKPAGAEWAPPAIVIRDTTYRFDGAGYLKAGRRHVFVVPADGGAARQVTYGKFDHCGARFQPPETPSWSADGQSLIVSAFRSNDAGDDPYASEIYEVPLGDTGIQRLTRRNGPDHHPVASPDGKHIAYLGFDDKKQMYQQTQLYIMNRDGSEPRILAAKLDRVVSHPQWHPDGSGVYVQYPEMGDIVVSLVTLKGEIQEVTDFVGGTDIGRPYSSGSYSVAKDRIAFTHANTMRPADVGTTSRGVTTFLTKLNESLLRRRKLGAIEDFHFPSSFDKKPVQGWIIKPPGFDPKKKYPLILEIHGGPFADYGPTFAAELQLYAAAGYVVVIINPRGSTGYGEAFAQLINHDYPGHDYDDLMSGVDAVIKKGFIDEKNLFVTGGSGGGVLTAWIVGKTDRFRAAVSSKPVINWTSFVLTADMPGFFNKYWLEAPPWEKPEDAMKRSPLSLVGKVKTPTMLLTGEEDHRTPIPESEQFYSALKLRGIDTALVRFPEASHAIVDRPSRLIAKTACILKWFETYHVKN
jgi:dipeptidyl aminopeptidase/acylaminoacyl peptidase